MATSVSVLTPGLTVDPGQSASTELRVRNTGDVVDQFAFQPLGEAAGWITVDPPVVRLFPDTDQIVTVTIAPPREPSSKPGLATWALKAIPQEDPEGAAVGEGTVDVGEFLEMSAELQPVNGRGRLTGRFDIAVDNRGNVPVPVRLLGSDTAQVLGFDVSPLAFEAAPGSAHFAKLRVKPPTRIWRGTPKTHPFQLVVEPQVRASGVTGNGDAPLPVAHALDGHDAAPGAVALAAPPVVQPLAPPIVLTGNFVQEAIIPKWLWKAVLALLALLIALWIVWKTLLEPQVESAARAVAIEEVAEVAEEVETLSTEVAQAEQQAVAAQETADEAAAAVDAVDAGGGGGGGAPPSTAPAGGDPAPTATTVADGGADGGAGGPTIGADAVATSFRLVAVADAGTNGSSASTPNPGTTTAITDLILQNPSGDIGFIRVLINGQVIHEAALESFATYDYHSVAPFVMPPGQSAAVEISCAPDQIVAADPCNAAVTFAGYNTTEPAG